jgi:hypothetical protein
MVMNTISNLTKELDFLMHTARNCSIQCRPTKEWDHKTYDGQQVSATTMGTGGDASLPTFFTCGDRQAYGPPFFGTDSASDNSRHSILK